MSKYVISWDSAYVRSCMHESAERYSGGLYCVYIWCDSFNDVFYVGSGKGYRFHYANDKVRSADFMSWFRNTKCYPLIVAYDMTKEESLDFEKRLIRVYWNMGFPLVNVMGIPEREREMLEKRSMTITKVLDKKRKQCV